MMDSPNVRLDICDRYNYHLKSHEPALPPHLACVSALVDAVAHNYLNTLSETLNLLSTLSSELKDSSSNPVPIAAGADRFQQILVTTLSRPQDGTGTRNGSKSTIDNKDGNEGFAHTKKRILQLGRNFVAQGLAARERIASFGHKFLRDGTTVIVPHRSKVVENLLLDAAGIKPLTSGLENTPRKSFRVIFMADGVVSELDESNHSWRSLDKRLRKAGVPTANIQSFELANTLTTLARTISSLSIFSCEGAAHDIDSMTAVDFPPFRTVFLVGAAALFASGGALVPLEVQNAALIATAAGREVWIAAEDSKMVKNIALVTSVESGTGSRTLEMKQTREEKPIKLDEERPGRMDMIPTNHLTGIITEFGPQSTDAVAERGVKLWF